MRERLGHREPALDRRQLSPEQHVRDVEPVARLDAERRLGPVEPLVVVRDDLARAGGGAPDRLAVAGERDPGREQGDVGERADVVAERVGPALRVEADRRRDRREHVVAGDENAVAEEAEVAVRVPGRRQHTPARDLVSGIDERRVPREADEVGEDVSRLDQILGDVGAARRCAGTTRRSAPASRPSPRPARIARSRAAPEAPARRARAPPPRPRRRDPDACA